VAPGPATPAAGPSPMVIELDRALPHDLEALVVPVCSDGLGAADVALDWTFLRNRGFEGKPGQLQSLPGEMGVVVVAVGMGPSSGVDPAGLRRAGATVARAVRRHKVVATTLLDAVPETGDRVAAAQALAEGLALASYSFTAYKSQPDRSRIERIVVVGAGGKKVRDALTRGARVAAGVAFARDLVNEPGGSLTPRHLADRAAEMADRVGLSIEILDEKAIARERLGGLLGVNRGSTEPPRLITLTYEPVGRSRGTIVLVGKGVTFDSGGLSIKTADGMSTMKDDMGGAAAILGALSAIDAVAPKVRVIAIIPSTDNMISGDATRPGDVLRIRNGKTVEVLNTDAEGRLILADALSLASEAKPDAIVDLATLTGACEVALGKRIAGLMGNNVDLADQAKDAAKRTGEQVWELPLPLEYRRQLDSDVADLRNIGTGRMGGALIAGLFLQEFVAGDIPWVHLDIAGPAWSDAVDGAVPKGGTGFGVRLLLDLLATFRRPA
jgi:leucyl aminopeptidase